MASISAASATLAPARHSRSVVVTPRARALPLGGASLGGRSAPRSRGVVSLGVASPRGLASSASPSSTPSPSSRHPHASPARHRTSRTPSHTRPPSPFASTRLFVVGADNLVVQWCASASSQHHTERRHHLSFDYASTSSPRRRHTTSTPRRDDRDDPSLARGRRPSSSRVVGRRASV